MPTSDAEAMLILPGIKRSGNNYDERGLLDRPSAVEYARRVGYVGVVLDVSGETGTGIQVREALKAIHANPRITALYGFSGGGYNARRIWASLTAAERARIPRVVVLGSPGVSAADFPGARNVVVRLDPPQGHMAGPRALLATLGPEVQPDTRRKPDDPEPAGAWNALMRILGRR